jgi:hypothetical protein
VLPCYTAIDGLFLSSYDDVTLAVGVAGIRDYPQYAQSLPAQQSSIQIDPCQGTVIVLPNAPNMQLNIHSQLLNVCATPDAIVQQDHIHYSN